jgi:hypothetical protein
MRIVHLLQLTNYVLQLGFSSIELVWLVSWICFNRRCIAANISSLAPHCLYKPIQTLSPPIIHTQKPSPPSLTPCCLHINPLKQHYNCCYPLIPSSPAVPSAPYSCSPPYPHNRLLDPHTSSPSRPPSTLTKHLFLRLWREAESKIKMKMVGQNQFIHLFLTFLLSLHFLLNLLP